MRDYYIVMVVVGGIIYRSGEMLLADAETACETFKSAAKFTNPQIHFSSTH